MEQNDFFAGSKSVTLEHMLDARERRAVIQQQLLKQFGQTLISFTLNIPGEYKAFPIAKQAFEEGLLCIAQQLGRARFEIVLQQENIGTTGYECYLVVHADAGNVKPLLIAIEEGHPLGRLFDLDVFESNGVALRGEAYGRKERRCLICGGPVWVCARNRIHSSTELAFCAAKLMQDYFNRKYADTVAAHAQKALLYEVSITPKPGLVDRENNGAHKDMDIFTFIDSACVLVPYFRDCTLRGLNFQGEPEELFHLLRYPGMCAEDTMFAATGGVNTHKGLIFSLGILCGAMGYLQRIGNHNPDCLAQVCGRMAGVTLGELQTGCEQTHGRNVFTKYGLTGIRGEAANGFPHAWQYGLPMLRKMVDAGYSLNDAGAVALLHLIAHVEDTNIIHRSDKSTQEYISRSVAAFLNTDPSVEQMLDAARSLDVRCICRNISPGGCADLLAVSLMLFFCFTNEKTPQNKENEASCTLQEQCIIGLASDLVTEVR
ncbi:citrate lyase holo-[acyl-carrier protein] synthase [Hydrogenoanaerobacterium sp.]|uniref:citrate lyase holo-[acyl-carrier protein] synthase n=1 Tax=Hydrogenoanaerobacterium sp. TaxID=2953763 RepID=UPI0028A1023A|nr:citrate lyase holo-[acyl-carrier protein] synthase [Hydrogenoanaerobacterium sp.]